MSAPVLGRLVRYLAPLPGLARVSRRFALFLSRGLGFPCGPSSCRVSHPRAPSESQQFLFPFTFFKLHCVET